VTGRQRQVSRARWPEQWRSSESRQTIGQEIENDQNLWDKLNKELAILREQRQRLKVRMGKREATRKEYDKTLVEASTALKKVQDTCTALMGVLKK
jgi:chromosome segregation ATPase